MSIARGIDKIGELSDRSDDSSWTVDHLIRCSARVARMAGGKVVDGGRCRNTMRIGHPHWFIVPGAPPPLVLCPSHSRGSWKSDLLDSCKSPTTAGSDVR